MKRIITIILMCLPFVAFGQTDYADRLMLAKEYSIIDDKITYKETHIFNTLDEAFSFIERANRTEKVRIIEDKELGIVSYKELYVARTVSVYGMTFEASWADGIIELTYRPERKDYSSVVEARKAYEAARRAILVEAMGVRGARGAYEAATRTSAIITEEYLRYTQPTEEELRAILKAVKEDYAPNSEIKKTRIEGEVSKTILITDIYQIGNYKIKVIKSDGIKAITICTR